jgi:hypothetical protein
MMGRSGAHLRSRLRRTGAASAREVRCGQVPRDRVFMPMACRSMLSRSLHSSSCHMQTKIHLSNLVDNQSTNSSKICVAPMQVHAGRSVASDPAPV